VRRGDVIKVVVPGSYGKPRPAVIIQKDLLAHRLDGIIICPITSDLRFEAPLRLALEPSPANGLRLRSRIMVDKIQAVPKEKVGGVIGRLEPDQIEELGRALMTVLDLL
jgi:mRNA interferase MazF